MPGHRRSCPRISLVILAAAAVAACSGDGPILANPPAPAPSIAPASPAPSRIADPVPIVLPRDDAPHDRLTEWWYYTGHLRSQDGRRFGFEYVIFRAERGAFPTSWVSHLAITDEAAGAFHYGQRLEVGPGVDRSAGDGAPVGFDLSIAGAEPTQPAGPPPLPWTMNGSNGNDRLVAQMTTQEAVAAGSPGGLGLDLALLATEPAVLHNGNGWVDFGPAGGSYYYSRPSMSAGGSLVLDGQELQVAGSAWFDHQWGDFISVGGGGWDWFAVNLVDRTDLTLSLVRAADGSYSLIYGTLVDADGTVRTLGRDAFTVAVTGQWKSPATGAEYPAGWTIEVPAEHLEIQLTPTVANQELDTRATTGVIYWEGSQVVRATRAGLPVGGEGYVELTGYASNVGVDS